MNRASNSCPDLTLGRTPRLLAAAPELALLGRLADSDYSPADRTMDPRIGAFQALPLAALIVDGIGAIVACNKAAAELTGGSLATLSGVGWWRLLSPAARDDQAEMTNRFVLHTAAGDRPVLLHRVPLLGSEDATPVLFLLEEPVAEDAQGAGEDAQGTRVDSFLLEVAHDLRSLLQSFNMALGGLADRAALSEKDERRLVTALQRSTVHMQALLENLLDAASLDASAFSILPAEIDLAEVVREAVLVVDPLLGPAKQHIDAFLPAAPLLTNSDARRIRQVLVNLLHNAIKYGPRGETIEVRAAREGGVARVEITDRGPGIAPEEQPHLFDRFYRGRVAQKGQQGNGLGLAIAKAIVEAHGGAIGVRSSQGAGTTFWFTLPLG